jgi:transcriptional regulator with XRE-family HTH domain
MRRRRHRRDYGSTRAVPHLRHQLGQRLRAVRQAAGLSMDATGLRAGLSGKFLGEVERGEKSISVDNLYHVARALGVPMRELLDGPRAAASLDGDGAKLFALVAGLRKPAEIRRAHTVLQTVLSSKT